MADPRVEAICTWFDSAQRDLPWRRHRSPYTALVAEAMLQQTQVARVVEKFDSFLQRFPDVQTLADADEQEVLQQWNGLGYYRRARHLHAAAQQVMADHGGVVPIDVVSLRSLPGVGRYTAGSIASIVGGQPEPIVDGNVLRVLQRWDADADDIRSPATMRRCWDRAAELVTQTDRPGVFNEALMEFGATICTPKSPKCEQCPVARWCNARRQERQDEIPNVGRAPTPATVNHHVVVVQRRKTVLLEQRSNEGLWALLWQPPTIESPCRLQTKTVVCRLPMRVDRLKLVDEFTFKTSSRTVVFRIFSGTTRIRSGRWQSIARLDALPMSNAHRKVLTRSLART